MIVCEMYIINSKENYLFIDIKNKPKQDGGTFVVKL